ncbi:MAG TPA: hypothetical protein VGO71_08715 [Baekduia sp.]|nr:hypothetical protein [Baekduia sp.]
MTVPRRLLATLVLVLSCGGGVAAAKGIGTPPPLQPKDEAAARQLALQSQAIDLINQASRHVYAKQPACKPSFPTARSTPTHDAPSQPVLEALAPLRRPAGPEDTPQPGSPVPFFGGGGETYVDYVRTVTTADGVPLTIVIGRIARGSFRPSAQCLDAEHAWLVHLLKGRSKALRSVTLDEFGKLRHGAEQSPASPTTPQDGIYLYSGGGGGGGAPIADFRKRGVFTSMGTPGGKGTSPRSTLNGLVPDGVATVALEYPKSVSRGPYYKPTVYPSALERTVPVHDNVLSVKVPRDATDAFPHRMVWRDAAGAIVNTFTEPAS